VVKRRYVVDRPCPALSEALARALVEVSMGEEFEVVTKWESAIEDVKSWAKLFGAEVLNVSRDGDWFRILVKR